MLYSDVHLPVPNGTKYEISKIRANNLYCYYRIKSFREKNGKLKHIRKCVGKVFKDEETSLMYLVPNSTYYEINNLTPPSGSKLVTVGRKPKHKESKTYQDSNH